MSPRLFVLVPLLAVLGCARSDAPPPGARPWVEFVRDLNDLDRLSRLDTAHNTLLSSYDRTGGNDDFNQFVAPGTERGWYVIADLKGPGVVRRFWTTGMELGHQFRLYFDGEKSPRLSGRVEDLFGGRQPFIVPLARNLNYCWFSYVPLTYHRSLRIEIQAPPLQHTGDRRRLFYQLNVETYAPGQPVETFPRTLSPAQLAVAAEVAKSWTSSVLPPPAPADLPPPMRIEAGDTATVWQGEGEGALREWALRVVPADDAEWTQVEREFLLQDVQLRVTYDGAAEPSICVPLGDFFLSGWRGRDIGSVVVGSSDSVFTSRLPMPYRKGMRIELVNQADRAIASSFAVVRATPRAPTDGYLHAVWLRSGPRPGAPHDILDIKGSGKFVGLFLGVTGLGQDWWILEGDEHFFVDGEARPSLHGTGLEDYFNGGWYYRGGAFAPLSGILDRAPFRVSQYRFHLPDPVHFKTSLKVDIERGDRNVSPGYFQSVAYYYLDAPTPVQACAVAREERRAVEHPYFRQTFMLQIVELERLNNFRAARNLTREYIERFPEAEENGVLELRLLEYARWLGEPIGPADYEPFLRGEHGPVAAEQARLLTWFYENPRRALVGLNANGAGQLFLDGQPVLQGDHPFNLFVAGIEPADGPRVLAAQGQITRQEPWIKAAIRTHTGFVGTGLGTWSSQGQQPGWNAPGGSLPTGERTIVANLVRGTPDAPMIGGIPNAFLLLESKAYAIRARDWGYAYRGPAFFREEFNVPATNFPAWSVDVTGLPW